MAVLSVVPKSKSLEMSDIKFVEASGIVADERLKVEASYNSDNWSVVSGDMENGCSKSAACLSNRLVPELSELNCFMVLYLVYPVVVVSFVYVSLEVAHRTG